MTNLTIEVHALQSVPPSNLNRDDTGSPKTAVYGGVRRARVSSQAWKRATRRDFNQYLDRTNVGIRTKRAVELIENRIAALRPELASEARRRAEDVVKKAGVSTKPVKLPKNAPADAEQPADQTQYLVLFSNLQLDALAELASRESCTAREAKAVFNSDNSFDLGLFGRMVADDAKSNVDAACQVAHAISTHGVENEYDYFTAVDDENPDDETGAGMIGTVEFNSATLYRFANINVELLRQNLGDDLAPRAVEAFIKSFVLSMPSGKVNTFANTTLPDGVVVIARQGRAVNLVGAFEDAVKESGDGYVKQSCKRMAAHAREIDEAYPAGIVGSWVCRVGSKTEDLDALGERMSLDELVARAGEVVRQAVVSL